MKFKVHGPFNLPRNGRRIRRTPADRYVFSIRGKAWYVGLAQRQSFRGECFQPHKIMLYGDALDQVSGNASLIFLAKVTNTGRFSKPTKNHYPAVEMLETMLIGYGVRINRKLMNIKGTKFLRSMSVPGVLNYGQGQARANPVQSLRRSLGV